MNLYQEVKVLGRSRSHEACLAVERTSRHYVVIKKYPEGHGISFGLWSALKTLKDQNHPNLLSVEYMTEYGASFAVAVEYAERGGLDQWLSRTQAEKLPEAYILRILHQLLSVLAFLHSRNIVHRAVRLKNVFLSGESDVKLGDLLDLPTGLESSTEDIRALGSLFYTLCTCPQPIKGNNRQIVPSSGQWRIKSTKLKDLICSMRDFQGENSLSATELLSSELLSWLEPVASPLQPLSTLLDPREDYAFPQPSLLLPRKSSSAQKLQECLVKSIGTERYIEVYRAVRRVMKDQSHSHYLSIPLMQETMSKEEIQMLLPLFKLLYLRDR